MNKIVRLLASAFGAGYLPVYPGAWGSLVGLAAAWLIPAGQLFYWTLFLTALGFVITAPAAKSFGSSDPQTFVLDEVAGMMISVLWIPKTVVFYVLAYILFRIFDSLKPFGIRRLEKVGGPLGIMWDDVAAGIVSLVLMQVVITIA